MPRLNHKYGFVVPRFGEAIAGGVETLVGLLAKRLHQRGTAVEVFATCAKDNRTWKNEFPVGSAIEYGVAVKRFLVDDRNLDLWVKHQIHLNDGIPLTIDDQLEWMREGVGSRALYQELLLRQHEFKHYFFGPYLFGTTFWGSLLLPQKSILIPCLHDEQNAYVDVIQSMFRQVKGAMFNAEPERELACRLYGPVPGKTVGMGFDSYPEKDILALTPYFDQKFPYLLYLGRKETGKNAHILIDYFLALKNSAAHLSNLKLVVAGAGSFSDLLRPQALGREDILDIQHVSEFDKRRLLRYALALCQPSCNESFSIVLMEAWLLGTPVIVHANGAVTKRHVLDSGGGLYFGSKTDFLAVVEELLKYSELRTALGQAGKAYVLEQYNWNAVLERFDRCMDYFEQLEVERAVEEAVREE